MGIIKKLKSTSRKMKSIIGILEIQNQNKKLNELIAEDYLAKNLYNNLKYKESKRLNKHEYQAFSQAGEDGIIEEIFKRIGETDRHFVDFGCSNGLENNTLNLLLKGWEGEWMEGDRQCVRNIESKYHTQIEQGKLKIKQVLINAENIEKLFKELKVPKEFDFLSIDIDGNDYWVWKAITHFNPRVVAVEYNAVFRPPIKWIMKYNPHHSWNGTTYYGASLKSLELLGEKKGYKLVGCDFLGTNAFFVRADLIKNKFEKPYTAENHYEAPKYFLLKGAGHLRDMGEFENQ